MHSGKIAGRGECCKWTDGCLDFYHDLRAKNDGEIAYETDLDCLKGLCCLTKYVNECPDPDKYDACEDI